MKCVADVSAKHGRLTIVVKDMAHTGSYQKFILRSLIVVSPMLRERSSCIIHVDNDRAYAAFRDLYSLDSDCSDVEEGEYSPTILVYAGNDYIAPS